MYDFLSGEGVYIMRFIACIYMFYYENFTMFSKLSPSFFTEMFCFSGDRSALYWLNLIARCSALRSIIRVNCCSDTCDILGRTRELQRQRGPTFNPQSLYRLISQEVDSTPIVPSLIDPLIEHICYCHQRHAHFRKWFPLDCICLPQIEVSRPMFGVQVHMLS